ncbi:hypothetical protein [Oligoflexus tunisiensis]|uniref:hypothetical protein n=1 Tax=Oligoflexus tunisiensis TaxID=708132 RepID=UPI00114D3173|nr:hypothetical protein [Oligoflexus tunisiensis]
MECKVLRLGLAFIFAAACLEAKAQPQEDDPARIASIIRHGLVQAESSTRNLNVRKDEALDKRVHESLQLTEQAGFQFGGTSRFSLDPVNPRDVQAEPFEDLLVAGSFASRLTDDGGAQAIAVMMDANDPFPAWTLTLPESTHAAVDEEGGIQFRMIVDGMELVLDHRLEKPWAVDAKGRQLETWYVLEGSTLVQHVDFSEAEFPIVLDPRLTFGLGVYLNMTGAEMKGIAAAIVAAGGVAAVATCSGATKLPSPIAKAAAVICTAVGAPTLKGIYNAIVSIVKSKKIDSGACYQKKIIPNTGSFKKVKFAGNCRA